MDTYRYCAIGPHGRVHEAREIECKSLEEARVVVRHILRTDPLWTAIELWRDGRRVHVEFSENTTADAHQEG